MVKGFVYIDIPTKKEYNMAVFTIFYGGDSMKKLITLLMAVLCLLLVACGNGPDQVATPDEPTEVTTEPTEATEPPTEPPTYANEKFDPAQCSDVIGEWSRTVVLDGAMFNLTDMEETVEMKFAYCLNEDGTYTRGVDPVEYRAAMTAYGEAIESFMLQQKYDTFASEQIIDEGVSKKKIPELWEQNEKAAAEEQCRRFVEDMHLEYRFSGINSSGDYYVEENTIYFSRGDGSYEACTYSFAGEVLIVEVPTNQKLYKQLKIDLPLALNNAENIIPENTETTEAAEE